MTLQRATKADPYLCIAYYQLGHVYQTTSKEIDPAIKAYELAISSMRGNLIINYTQMGLSVAVRACEVHYNLAALFNLKADGRGKALSCLLMANQANSISEKLFETIYVPPKSKIFRQRENRILQMALLVESLESKSINLSNSHLTSGKSSDTECPSTITNINSEFWRSSRSSDISILSDTESYFIKIHSPNESSERDDIRLIQVEQVDLLNYQGLLIKVRQKLKSQAVLITYRDDDGDLISICDDNDLMCARQAFPGQKDSRIKLSLFCQYPK